MRYLKKPVVVEAWQFTKKNFAKGVPEFILYAPDKPITLFSQYAGSVIYGELKTPDGLIKINEGDYIVKDEQGEPQHWRQKLFESTYEKETK
ncbi:hypothetical protein ACTQ5K_02790 [Niallia sp. Sow4_A1]|uniref:hypothetical protein n=1 Tax=Niallia sp. Sow4_A1 TaxID=3438793 RepID=UPI003F9D601F